jgi:hypothetical protein
MKKLVLVLSLVGISIFNPAFSNVEDPIKISSSKSEIEILDSLVKARYGESIQIDLNFEIGCINLVKEQTENRKIGFTQGQAHVNFFASAKGSLPTKSTLIEVFNERFDYLESLGLPINPNRYFIKTMVVGDEYFIVVALDEKIR